MGLDDKEEILGVPAALGRERQQPSPWMRM